MSTKIEDLSDSGEEELYDDYEGDHYEDIHEEDLVVKKKAKKEKFTQDEEEQPPINGFLKNLAEKIKDPILVSIIMMILTHPLLIKGIFRIPYVEVADGTIGVNIILSIIAGILFYFLRDIF
jgi:hypothetical protein